MKVRLKNLMSYVIDNKIGDIVEARIYHNIGYECLCNYNNKQYWLFFRHDAVEVIDETTQKDQHYNNEKGSLYLFAQQHELNAWEFDILKRIVRCRKKGQFTDDLEKTKRVIDLYLKEFLS